MPSNYKPIWFTTDRQLNALTSGYANASLITKLTGRFDVPEGIVHLRGVLMPWMRMPLVLSTQGELSISQQALSFKPKPFRAFGWSVRGELKELAFSINAEDVLSVEPADFSSPVIRLFDLPFTRIRTKLPAPLDNFLLCVGGRIAMPIIKARSNELRGKIIDWKCQHKASATQ